MIPVLLCGAVGVSACEGSEDVEAGAERAPAAAEKAHASALTGSFLCGVYLNNVFTVTQRLTLTSGGTYESGEDGRGRFQYDEAARRVEFLSGPLSELVGQHEPENKGIVRLTQKADLEESAHEQKWRSQTCSPQSD